MSKTSPKRQKYKYEMKPLFEERMKKLIPDSKDFEAFESIVHTSPQKWIRCNTLKTSPEKLLERLSKKSWEVQQPFPKYPEIMLVTSNLLPGELGNSIEHLLGYFYIQEVSSMLPPLALNPQPGELILDAAASPGSKTTQIASMMKNSGVLIANDLKIGRISILSNNLERCGVSNTIITRDDAISLTKKLSDSNYKFDKILLDVPCSGEGTLRSSPKTFKMWNLKVIKSLSRQQKKFIANALKCLRVGGCLIYSTCTHSPEENESVVNFALENFPVKIETLNLPLKSRPGIESWEGETFNSEITKACRIYPHDNNSEGFFLAKLTLLGEIK
jgi:NOL1/NOP2/sun family putative RNA methylase